MLVADLLEETVGVGWGDRHAVQPRAAEEPLGAGEHREGQLARRRGDGACEPVLAERVGLPTHAATVGHLGQPD